MGSSKPPTSLFQKVSSIGDKVFCSPGLGFLVNLSPPPSLSVTEESISLLIPSMTISFKVKEKEDHALSFDVKDGPTSIAPRYTDKVGYLTPVSLNMVKVRLRCTSGGPTKRYVRKNGRKRRKKPYVRQLN